VDQFNNKVFTDLKRLHGDNFQVDWVKSIDECLSLVSMSVKSIVIVSGRLSFDLCSRIAKNKN
jgi:hypothetical protein